MSELTSYMDELSDSPCGQLFRLLATQVEQLGSDVHADVGSWGVRFRLASRTLCELSPFGALFRVRVGDDQSIEYRVRDQGVALLALDQILLEYLRQKSTRPAAARVDSSKP